MWYNGAAFGRPFFMTKVTKGTAPFVISILQNLRNTGPFDAASL